MYTSWDRKCHFQGHVTLTYKVTRQGHDIHLYSIDFYEVKSIETKKFECSSMYTSGDRKCHFQGHVTLTYKVTRQGHDIGLLKILLCNIFPWFYFGCSTHKGLNDFFSPKLFKHDAHFSTRQNMETWNFLEKKSNFSLHGFLRYLTPNMALQKIILTFFVFLFFVFLLLPDRGLCVLRALTSRRYWAIGTKFRRHAQRWM